MVSINIITPVSAPAPSIVGNLNQAGDINHVLTPVSQPSQSPWEHDAADLNTPPPTFFYKITACIQGRQRQSLFFHGGVTQAFNSYYIALSHLVLPLILPLFPQLVLALSSGRCLLLLVSTILHPHYSLNFDDYFTFQLKFSHYSTIITRAQYNQHQSTYISFNTTQADHAEDP